MTAATIEQKQDEFLPAWADYATKWRTDPMGGGLERFVELRRGNFTIMQYQLLAGGPLKTGEITVIINCDEIGSGPIGQTAQKMREFASQAHEIADILAGIATETPVDGEAA